MCSAAILAGGASRRLGGVDKAMLLVGGRTILDRQIAALAPVARDVRLVVGDAARAERYRSVGVPVVADVRAGAALGGIYTALLSAAEPRTIVVACDMPFLTTAFLAYLAAAAPDADVTIPRTPDGLQPLCACYSHRCAEPIRRQLETGAFKIVDVFGTLKVREIGPDEVARFDPNGTLFFNINTPEDHARAQDLEEVRDR